MSYNFMFILLCSLFNCNHESSFFNRQSSSSAIDIRLGTKDNLFTDGVYLIDRQGRSTELIRSSAHYGYIASNPLMSYWKQPKGWYATDANIFEVSSVKKIRIIGAEFDNQTMKKINFLIMNKVDKPMLYTTEGKRHNVESIYKTIRGDWDKTDLVKKKTISTTSKEITFSQSLEKSVVYALWINETYYFFRITD